MNESIYFELTLRGDWEIPVRNILFVCKFLWMKYELEHMV